MNIKVKKVLKLACLEAGKIILKNYGKKKNVKSKGNNDWVTNQDIIICSIYWVNNPCNI